MEENGKPTTNGEKLTIIAERTAAMDKALNDLICTYKQDSRERANQWMEYRVEHQKLVSRVDEHDEDIADIKTDIVTMTQDVKEMKKTVAPFVVWHKILVWFAAIMGASVLGLIWSLITGAVKLTGAM